MNEWTNNDDEILRKRQVFVCVCVCAATTNKQKKMKRTNSNSGRLFVIICLLNIIVESSSAASSIEGIVDLKSRINRLTLSKSTRNNLANKPVDLFVASTNHLYKIVDYDLNTADSAKSGLQIEIDLVTGPKLQKQQCAFITESIGPSNSGAQCIKVEFYRVYFIITSEN